MAANPGKIPFGYSPGYFGQAVDGNYIRVLGETGLIGAAVFIMFLVAVYNSGVPGSITRDCLIIVSVTALFIDIFWSSKVMALLWFLSSWEWGRSENLSAQARNAPGSGVQTD
jgi:hypothetical protein